MELLFKLVVVALLAWGLWLAAQPRCAFVVRVAAGVPRAVKGVVTPAFLEQVRQVYSEHGVRSGTVRGLIRGRRIALGFAGKIPPGGQQQLRNWWALSGWSAPLAEQRGPTRRA
jgi:hypothetical protein